jgi:hypothetical protein
MLSGKPAASIEYLPGWFQKKVMSISLKKKAKESNSAISQYHFHSAVQMNHNRECRESTEEKAVKDMCWN